MNEYLKLELTGLEYFSQSNESPMQQTQRRLLVFRKRSVLSWNVVGISKNPNACKKKGIVDVMGHGV